MPVGTRRPAQPGPFQQNNIDESLDDFVTSNAAFDALASAAQSTYASGAFFSQLLRSSDCSSAYAPPTLPEATHGQFQYPSSNALSGAFEEMANQFTNVSQDWISMSTTMAMDVQSGPPPSHSTSFVTQVASSNPKGSMYSLPVGSCTTFGYELAASVPTTQGYQTYFAQSAETTALQGIPPSNIPTNQSSDTAPSPWLNEFIDDGYLNDDFAQSMEPLRYQSPSYVLVPATPVETTFNSGSAAAKPTPIPESPSAYGFVPETPVDPVNIKSRSTSSKAPAQTPRSNQRSQVPNAQSNALTVGTKRKRGPLEQFKETMCTTSDGSLVGTFATFGNIGGRRAYTSEDRGKTARTRRLGACDLCRKMKKRCDRPTSPYECCKHCKDSDSPLVIELPCFLAKIIEAQLFRDKPSPGHPEALRREVYDSLQDVARRQARPTRVVLTQDFGVQLEVSIAYYEPKPGDSTARKWKDANGVTHELELPPYCIANMEEAQERLVEYIRDHRGAFIKSILGRSNEITKRIFDQAQRYVVFNPESLVSDALSLCAASRIIERDWRVVTPEGHIIPFITDNPQNPFYQTYPITTMMDAQLDQIVIRKFLLDLRERLLHQLQATMTTSTDRNSWYEIFLTLAILLSHSEWLLDHSRRNAIRVGAKSRYNYIPRAEAYFHACRIMLAHWHNLCGSTAPLSIGLSKLQGEEKEFVGDLKSLVECKEPSLRELREKNMYEAELHWCHQLFFPGWKAGKLSIEDVMG